ncbi:MAG: acyl carrier protein [Bacteroidetes bacterium]|jgi:D-alanine--poly(phosphoribitol) ligase subunit 2|nr:acyl carrier protein [Bacteroidota bacterium]
MKNKILEIVGQVRPDIDFATEQTLIDSGILDSFDIVSIISDLNDEFDISIRITELKPENFNSVDAILALVERLKA